MTRRLQRNAFFPNASIVVSATISHQTGVSSNAFIVEWLYLCFFCSHLTWITYDTTLAIIRSGSCWATKVFLLKDKPFLFLNFVNQPLEALKSISLTSFWFISLNVTWAFFIISLLETRRPRETSSNFVPSGFRPAQSTSLLAFVTSCRKDTFILNLLPFPFSYSSFIDLKVARCRSISVYFSVGDCLFFYFRAVFMSFSSFVWYFVSI